MEIRPEHKVEFKYVGDNKKLDDVNFPVIRNPSSEYKKGDVIYFVSAESEKPFNILEVTNVRNEVHYIEDLYSEQVTVVSVSDHIDNGVEK